MRTRESFFSGQAFSTLPPIMPLIMPLAELSAGMSFGDVAATK